MRILVLNWWDRTAPRAGGAEVHLHQIFGRIAGWGNRVTLLCCRYSGCRPEEWLDGIRVVRRGGPPTINLLTPAWVRTHAAGFDVVVDYTNKIPFLTPLYVPLPRLCVAHHVNGVAFRREFPEPLASLLIAVERAIYRRVYCRETFTAVSRSTAEELVELGVRPDRVHVIYNGADHLDHGGAGAPSPVPLLIYTGRLKRYKNLDQLLFAVQALVADVPDVRLVIVGGGDQRRCLATLAQRLGLAGRVAFCGVAGDGELARWLGAAWVTVNLSAKEGWGLGVLEAARYGVPAVGADAPGLRDSIVDGETGLLVPSGDPTRLRDALHRLLTDAALRRTLGENARARADGFRWEQAATETLRVIETLVNQR